MLLYARLIGLDGIKNHEAIQANHLKRYNSCIGVRELEKFK